MMKKMEGMNHTLLSCSKPFSQASVKHSEGKQYGPLRGKKKKTGLILKCCKIQAFFQCHNLSHRFFGSLM